MVSRGVPASPVLAADRSSISDVIEVYKRGIDRSLLRESLRRTPQERLEALMELQKLARELRLAGRRR